jgi:hypothetical protein
LRPLRKPRFAFHERPNQKMRGCNPPFRLDIRLRSCKQRGTHGRVYCVLARNR